MKRSSLFSIVGGIALAIGVAGVLWSQREGRVRAQAEAQAAVGRASAKGVVAGEGSAAAGGPSRDGDPRSGATAPIGATSGEEARATGDPRAAAEAAALVARLAELAAPGRLLSEGEQRELAGLEGRIAALGGPAAAALMARLDGGKDAPAARELVFNVLRRMPGEAVEARLVAEARRAGEAPAMRTMAIESLAARRSEGALAALADIARHDPELPARPLVAGPRDPSDTSTELPDETVFSPRMQAMAALAATGDGRAAVPVLAEVVRGGAEESLRMEAARNLEPFRADPRAAEVLRAAALSDPSAYVRLAALHALHGASDPELPPVLEGIAARDRDAGVRILAQQLLADLRR